MVTQWKKTSPTLHLLSCKWIIEPLHLHARIGFSATELAYWTACVITCYENTGHSNIIFWFHERFCSLKCLNLSNMFRTKLSRVALSGWDGALTSLEKGIAVCTLNNLRRYAAQPQPAFPERTAPFKLRKLYLPCPAETFGENLQCHILEKDYAPRAFSMVVPLLQRILTGFNWIGFVDVETSLAMCCLSPWIVFFP